MMGVGVLFLSGLIVTAILIPLVKRISFNIGYLDRPEGDVLKIHAVAVPHSGGIAIFTVFGLSIGALFFAGNITGFHVVGLLLGAGLAFASGVWADLRPAIPAIRLIIQILAGVALILWGDKIDAPFFFSIPLILFYVVGAINAINMEDGLDGLAGGMALISCAGFAFLSAGTGRATELAISSVLAGTLLGFLFYNYHPASVFMGDNGSYFIGFAIAYLALCFTSFNHWANFAAPILVVGVPVFDIAYAILRRLRRGVSPFTGDRSHFYDQLMGRGLSVRRTVLICWGIQFILVGIGVVMYNARS